MTTFQPAVESQSQSQTLAQKMSSGRLPVGEALRYAIQVAESLQRLHDEGRVHGSLSPAAIAINGRDLYLLPASDAPGSAAYTAPEVAQGHPADARADIFGFGAILYEMLTGERAFQGDDPHGVPSSGSRPVDRVVQTCVAEDPNKRYQKITKLMLELKLLAVAARRAESAAPVKKEDAAELLRADMVRLEQRIVERFDAQERARTELAHSVGAAIEELRAEVDAAAKRDAALEHSLDTLDRAAADVRDSVTKDLESVSTTLKSYASAIDSARIAMAQTDNLVERVVEALEALQAIVLEDTAGQ